MTEVRKRKTYSPEFKAKVGLEAVRGLRTASEMGQGYSVHPVQPSRLGKSAALPDY